MRTRDRTEDGERSDRTGGEDDELDHPPGAERRYDHRRNRRDGNRPEEEETRREDLADRESYSDNSPEQPGRHLPILRQFLVRVFPVKRDSVAGVFAMLAAACGIASIITRPFLFAPIGMLLLLVSVKLSADRRWTAPAAAIVALGGLAG